jgi:prevent-host-death family protein
MSEVYSTYEAKARFSEVIRKVQAGQRIVISYRGREIAEIRPLDQAASSLERGLALLEDRGVVRGSGRPSGVLRPLARRPGAVRRFLESRE